MNSAKSFFSRQLGILPWKNYDMAIKRLICRKDEEFRWIFPDDAVEGGSVDPPIFACKFAHVKGYEHILALANEDGRIAIYDVESKAPRYGGNAHNNAIFDIAWMPKGMKLVSASGDHTAALFDVQNGDIVIERVFHGHSRSLKSVACRINDSFVFATGARDGKIIMWDARVPKSDIMCIPDVSLPWTHHHPSQVTKMRTKTGKMQDVVSGSSSVTGLVFQDYYTLMSCGAGDGLVKVWDMRKTYYAANRAPIPKYTLPYAGNTWRNGFSNLLLNSGGTKLYANCLDNVIYCYNVATYDPKPVMKYIGHKNSTFYVKASLSPDELYLLGGSSDNKAYIWRTDSRNPILELEGHEAEVTCVAWCENGSNVLVTCSDDLRHKIWRVGPEIIPDHLAIEIASRASITPHQPKAVNTPRTIRKRANENLYAYEASRASAEKFRSSAFRCGHSRCRKIYDDEFLMVLRNQAMEESLLKKLKMESKRKRKLLATLDQNVPENPTTSDEDEEEILAKRLKPDPDFKATENTLTDNLPNFVIDGSAPHLNVSPVKKQEKDWLTKLRMTRMTAKNIQELSKPSPSKMPKVDTKTKSPRTTRNSNKSNDAPHSSSQSPLLKFFKVTNSSTSTSTQCRAKSPNLVSSSPSTKSQSQSSSN